MRSSVKVITPVLFALLAAPLLAQDQQKPAQVSENVLAARILNDDSLKQAAGAWSVVVPDPEHASSVVFATEAVSGTSEAGEKVPALLTVSCIRREASVNILFDGSGEVMSSVVQIDVDAPSTGEITYYGVPLPSEDSVGVFRGTANYFVQDIQSSDYIDVTLPTEKLSWRFNIDGLMDALMLVNDDCFFINWKTIDPSFLRLALLELLRKSSETGGLQNEIELLSRLIAGDRIGPELQKSDYEALQRILRELTDQKT